MIELEKREKGELVLEKGEKYKLTIPQENIWLIEQLNTNTNINNVFGIFYIQQELELEILVRVMQKIVENNEALRIQITEEKGQPFQYIVENKQPEIHLYETQNKKETETIINKIREERINIWDHPLYDISLIKEAKSTYVCVKLHHIIGDAWTQNLVAEQIKQYYIALKEKQELEKKPSYIDYMQKDKEYRKSEKYLKDKNFWNEYITDLECRNDFEITENKKSKRIIKPLTHEMFSKIEKFCKANSISEYSFLLAIVAVYYTKLSGMDKIVIGTPFLNRKKLDKELEMMGMFIATLPMNIHIDYKADFVSLCKQIGSTNMSCFKHARYPYYEIQKTYQEYSGQNINLYEIAFSYQINKLETQLNGDVGKTTWICNNTQATPLLISYVNHFGEHQVYYDYMESCFEELDIYCLHERILTIIQQIIANGNILIEEIEIISQTDKEKLQEFNKTGEIPSLTETIITQFEKMCEQYSDHLAVKCGDNTVTYKELNEKVIRMAKELLSNKIGANMAVAILLDKSISMIVSMLAVMKIGAYYIPILPEEENGRIEYILQDAQVKIVITQKEYKNKIPADMVKIKIGQLAESNLQNITTYMPKSSDICYIIYTSGTTGNPKGVVLEHQNILSLINSMNQDKDFKTLPEDIAISLLKYSFDASAIDIYATLLNGATLILVPKEKELNPEEVVNIIEKENVTRTFTVHKWIEQLQSIAIRKRMTLQNLRIIGTGAEVLKPYNFKKLLETYPKLGLYNTYGPTETTMFITKHKVGQEDIQKNAAPIGKLIPFVRAVVMNNKNEILPIGANGELVVFKEENSSQNIAREYWNLPEITNKKFISFMNPYNNKWVNGYKTGDIVKINNQLELEFFGRRDDMVKVNGGYLVSLTEVGSKIQNILKDSVESCVITYPIKNVNTIVLFIANRGRKIATEEIKYQIDKEISFYMKPRRIIEIEEIPRTKNGKVDRKALIKEAEKILQNPERRIEPKTKEEKFIYQKVKEIIKSDFSITDDFEEDLGIDSLNMTILYTKLANKEITIQDLYNYSSVKDLAYMLATQKSQNRDIEAKEIIVKNNARKMDLTNVMITGITGFVGVHLLKELAKLKETKNIYCIVRDKLDATSKERFYKTIHYYFDEKTCAEIEKKAIIITGDITKPKLGIELSKFYDIIKTVKTIINTAANVKHIGKYHKFYKDNVESVKNVIEVCKEYHLSLVHISTLSLNGYNGNRTFDENVLNIHQNFNKNPYLISKYEAEMQILQAINQGSLNAKIFRLGNIMPRMEDGKFQKNYEQNAFLLIIKEIRHMQMQVEQMKGLNTYLTPVDECCTAIMRILDSTQTNNIYHIENDNLVSIDKIIELLKDQGISFQPVDMATFREQLYKNYNIGVEHLKEIIEHKSNNYSNQTTNRILESLGFQWNDITDSYLENIIKIVEDIK